ncbi:Gfo/Idh/MocA family protein [Botrimarina hoheduenensis]|uniref:Inositol 2-dehydrogenase n=1 Tax=Botrimarina hoheduenensis TaxID=2528000 RepID=A0A5C5VWB3_9BACT|nr:Gfo/Idh/MocA family oxidoreductase [Botrimarina hoheduenensis]TWT42908.1 Inositol 2-dehydrogenase [Botrimarina hoheduenensis]
MSTNRREFLQFSAASFWVGSSVVGAPSLARAAARSANERPVFGFIGSGIQFQTLIRSGCVFGPCAAVCDVDAVQRGRGVETARIEHYARDYPITIYNYEDHRAVLDRDDIDAVVIATPDHWHAKIATEAMDAGKDIYCEKPLTLTIDEGRRLADHVAKTGRVLQVGTMQRTEFGRSFATAAAMVRDGRIGTLKRVTCAIGGSPQPFPIPPAPTPKHLNWDRWLGPAPWTEYLATPQILKDRGYESGHPGSRTHAFFRWWYEYSGGKLTDWGAHHVDCAMWALDRGHADIGQYTLDPLRVEHPNPMDKDGMPVHTDRYNTATQFHTRVELEDGLVIDIVDSAVETLGFDNGIMFEGENGKFFVNRGKLTGKPVEDLQTNPLAADALDRLYGRTNVAPTHMGDFVDCLKTRQTPVSDAESHHRNLTVCHAANVALRLGRKLTFDPATERFVGDDQANRFLARTPRKGYEW